MSRITLAALVGGAAGAISLVGLIALLVWFCVFHSRSASRTSETGSSEPSYQGRHGGIELSLRDARRFEMEELSMSTKNFSEVNLIGAGKFGEVYKGLLHDGVLVAIKKRHGPPNQEFVDEVRFLSSIQHRNLVSLLGYCQENNLQFLVYEYVPNGSVSSHLFGPSQASSEKLEFKHRLSIAIGAAKGLAHIHSLSPRLVHKNFKTANVLVDENFIPKVADSGLPNILAKGDLEGSSSQATIDEIFLSPEVKEFGRFSEKSDTYSFGVFLLELLSGREASILSSPVTNQNVIELLQTNEDYSKLPKILDQRMGTRFTVEGMEEYIQLIIRCIELSSERRPGMNYVVVELERILEKEMNLTSVMGEGMPNVTLGSQLFKSMK